MFSRYTTYLARRLCAGSSRKLIAGWWYTILALTAALMLMSFVVMGRRPFSEGFCSFWSGLLLCGLSVGGTMIMRKFHNSMAVGFFMGVTVASSQLFAVLALVYTSYRREQQLIQASVKEETLMIIMVSAQAILLASFAAILAAHRTEILDKQQQQQQQQQHPAGGGEHADQNSENSYQPPPPSGGRA